METKNTIVQNYAKSILAAANSILNETMRLNDSVEENAATIKTLNVLSESLRSHTVLFQSALDEYK